MDRVATRYAPRVASLWPAIAFNLALNRGVRSNASTNPNSVNWARPKRLRKSEPWSHGKKVKDGHAQEQLQRTTHVLRFRQFADIINDNLLVNRGDLTAWIEEFLWLGSLQVLGGSDCGEVVRVLHNLDRKYRKERNDNNQKLVHVLVEKVRQAYVSRLLPSTSHVPLHLLSYYKESGHLVEGIEFWKWLSTDEAKLDPVYAGAAIELLALYGAGIRYCEDVYERTLLQQERIGTQYYLSPGAILPDRSKAVVISGTSLGLLQGILSARLFYGQWQRSYLVLDTAMTLRPTQIVPRFLDLFVYGRPIFEALPVFFMYCRGGNVVSSVTLTAILNSLRGLSEHVSHYNIRMQLIQAMFRVVEAYTASAGRLGPPHLNILTSAFLGAMPPKPAVTPTESVEGDEEFMYMVIHFFTNLFVYFYRHNASPNSTTFGEMISKAVSLRYFALAKVIFQNMLSLDISPSESTAIRMIKAAAMLRDPDLLKSAWSCILGASKPTPSKPVNAPDPRSWKALAAAARTCGLESFVEDELEALFEENLPQAISAIRSVKGDTLEKLVPTEPNPEGLVPVDMHAFANLCAEMSSSLHNTESLQRTGFRDFQKHPVDEPSIFKWPEIAEESWQRKLFDELSLEMTTGNSLPTLPDNTAGLQDATPDISNTGIAFDELRYTNWKTINNLLIQTEVWERRVEESRDTAVKEQKATPRQEGSKNLAKPTAIRYPVTAQQLEAYQQDVEHEWASSKTEEEWRNRILRLRNPDYEVQVHTITTLPP